jgi:transcriptional regulator of acetoin/glycerol metabolism
MGRAIEPLSDRDIRRLKSYNWPGNVRELQNVIERAVITSQGGRLNLDRALPEIDKDISTTTTALAEEQTERIRTIHEIEELERQNLIRALEATNWRVSGENGAARLLGINSSTLSSRMKALGIKRPR